MHVTAGRRQGVAVGLERADGGTAMFGLVARRPATARRRDPFVAACFQETAVGADRSAMSAATWSLSELVELEPTASEINALANLADGRDRTVFELGAVVGTRPTTLTSVLDRLERRGHITRGTRANDRRSVLIEPTPSGRSAADTIRRRPAAMEDRALGDLPAEAVAGFHTVLRALTELAA